MEDTSLQISQARTAGTLHEGQPEGNFSKIGNNSTYFAYPEDKTTKNAILLLTDFMGHQSLNAQLIADQFAAHGYFVVMPDLFNGDAVKIPKPEGFDINDWCENHNPPQIAPIIDAVLEEMRENLGCERIGGVGYCFGAKYICRYVRPGELDVGFIAHPTELTREDLMNLEGPLSIAAAGRDVAFTTAQRHECEEELKTLEVPYEINVFPDVAHGFAVRCDLTSPRHRFAKEQAFDQAIVWFQIFL